MASITDIGVEVDPLNGPFFGGPSGWAAAVRDALNGSDITVDARIAAHAAAADPHPTYLQTAEGDARYSLLSHNHDGVYDPVGTASSAVSAHVAAGDPHTQYQRESEKGAASGYAPLDATGKVPSVNLPTIVSDHGTLTGLSDDDHPQYLTSARGDARYDAVGTAASAVSAHEAAGDPHGQYLLEANLPTEVAVGTVAPTDPETLLWIDEGSNYP
jgi:hypothetical protein